MNEAFANRYFPNSDPLGQRIIIGRVMGAQYARSAPVEVVGVVTDSKQMNLMDPPPETIYVPTVQVPNALMEALRGTTFVIRTAGDPLALAGAVREVMAGIDKGQPVRTLRSMEDVLSSSIAPQRFNMLLLGLFAGLGLVLAAVGVYGVMSYSVSQRTHEIGIRMALGARSIDVLRIVLKQGMLLAGIGMTIGLALSFWLTRFLEAGLFGVGATDPMTFAGIAVLLAIVAFAACYLPARRAARVDPMIALRYE